MTIKPHFPWKYLSPLAPDWRMIENSISHIMDKEDGKLSDQRFLTHAPGRCLIFAARIADISNAELGRTKEHVPLVACCDGSRPLKTRASSERI